VLHFLQPTLGERHHICDRKFVARRIISREIQSMLKSSKHSQETRDRIQANSEAAKKRLALLNVEYALRQKARQITRTKSKPKTESFGQAVARIAKENQFAI